MPIACPNCDHCFRMNAVLPGRYRPRCPRCDKSFALLVPDQGSAALEASAVDSQGTHAALATQTQRASQSQNFAHRPTTPDLRSDSNHGSDSSVEVRVEVPGYRIVRELGRGGMGTVFLAQQVSLDRPVALKVMSRGWVGDATFVSRFTREAFAAAQLSHPNIVQIHDIGEVDGARFFSMEYVPGRSLADVLKRQGKLDPETAVGYLLQAARGLKHAHDRGMIHRDVKPDNLLLDDHGLLKVADLGLVKTQNFVEHASHRNGSDTPQSEVLSSNLTGVRIALGTPAYMSPEQCRDATAVDRRADIYSLGCTLYVLVTGRPPFNGNTAVELMTKQAYEPIVPPERFVARVPAELSAVIQRMMAKNADDRFQTMDDVIRTLEAWLGVRTAGSFCPREAEIAQLERFVHSFNTAPKAVLRGRIVSGFFGFVLLASLLLLFFGRPAWSLGVVSLLVQTCVAYFVINGLTRKGPLFIHTRQFLWGLGWWDWGLGLAGIGLFALLLAMSGLFWTWAGFGVIGVGLALALHVGVDRAAAAERRVPLDACVKLLRGLRAQGLDEQNLRAFVAKFSGRNWEAFFEALFGYEAKLEARESLLRGGSRREREKHADWREPILHALLRIETVRKHERERKLLAAVERAKLLAAGATRDAAERQANATAEALVNTADEVHRRESDHLEIGPGVGAIMSGASNLEFALEPPAPDPHGAFAARFLGAYVRAALAAVLLAACGLWAHQNGMLPFLDSGELAIHVSTRIATPLEIDGLEPRMTHWVDSFNVGIAGLLLMGSLCFRGNAMSVLVLVGAGVAVAGHHLGIRTVEPMSNYHFGLLLGTVLSLVGFRLGSR